MISICMALLMVFCTPLGAVDAPTEPATIPEITDFLNYSVFLSGEALKDLQADLSRAGLDPKGVADYVMHQLNVPVHDYRYQASSEHIVWDQDGKSMILERGFLYRRLIRGIPVYGPGSYIIISVGNQGELKSVEVSWPELSVDVNSMGLMADSAGKGSVKSLGPCTPSLGADAKGLRIKGMRYLNRPGPNGRLETVPALLVVRDPEPPSGTTNEPTGETRLFLPMVNQSEK